MTATTNVTVTNLLAAVAGYKKWAKQQLIEDEAEMAEEFAASKNKCRRWWRREPLSPAEAVVTLRHEAANNGFSIIGLRFSNLTRRAQNRLQWAAQLESAARASDDGMVSIDDGTAYRLKTWLAHQ